MIRGIRGATTVERDTEMEVISAVEKLMAEIIQVNEIDPDMVASVFFLLRKRFVLFSCQSLEEIRRLDLCTGYMHERNTGEQFLAICIRVMIHVNTTKSQKRYSMYTRQGLRSYVQI